MKIYDEEQEADIELSADIFKGAMALLGVCITAISLFEVTNNRVNHYVDEVLCVSSGLFAIASLLSYSFLRNGKNRNYKKASDLIFLMGLWSMLGAGLFLIFQL